MYSRSSAVESCMGTTFNPNCYTGKWRSNFSHAWLRFRTGECLNETVVSGYIVHYRLTRFALLSLHLCFVVYSGFSLSSQLCTLTLNWLHGAWLYHLAWVQCGLTFMTYHMLRWSVPISSWYAHCTRDTYKLLYTTLIIMRLCPSNLFIYVPAYNSRSGWSGHEFLWVKLVGSQISLGRVGRITNFFGSGWSGHEFLWVRLVGSRISLGPVGRVTNFFSSGWSGHKFLWVKLVGSRISLGQVGRVTNYFGSGWSGHEFLWVRLVWSRISFSQVGRVTNFFGSGWSGHEFLWVMLVGSRISLGQVGRTTNFFGSGWSGHEFLWVRLVGSRISLGQVGRVTNFFRSGWSGHEFRWDGLVGSCMHEFCRVGLVESRILLGQVVSAWYNLTQQNSWLDYQPISVSILTY